MGLFGSFWYSCIFLRYPSQLNHLIESLEVKQGEASLVGVWKLKVYQQTLPKPATAFVVQRVCAQ
jgi:hypothetical protein